MFTNRDVIDLPSVRGGRSIRVEIEPDTNIGFTRPLRQVELLIGPFGSFARHGIAVVPCRAVFGDLQVPSVIARHVKLVAET